METGYEHHDILLGPDIGASIDGTHLDRARAGAFQTTLRAMEKEMWAGAESGVYRQGYRVF